jgi:hypothetical protein
MMRRERISELYGWPQTFIGADAVALHETDG